MEKDARRKVISHELFTGPAKCESQFSTIGMFVKESRQVTEHLTCVATQLDCILRGSSTRFFSKIISFEEGREKEKENGETIRRQS